MTEHMSKVGSNLDKAVDSYNSMVGSYDRKVIPQLRRFDGAARTRLPGLRHQHEGQLFAYALLVARRGGHDRHHRLR